MNSSDLLRKVGYLCLFAGGIMLVAVMWVFFSTFNAQVTADQPPALSEKPNDQTKGNIAIAADTQPAAPLNAVEPSLVEGFAENSGETLQFSSIEEERFETREVFLETESGRERYLTTQATLGGFLTEINHKLYASDKIYADGNLIDAFDLDQFPLPEMVMIGRFVSVTVVDEGLTQVIRTSAETVEEALLDAQIALFTADQTEPALDSAIAPDMTINIQRSIPIVLQVDGAVIQTRTIHRSSQAVVESEGIALVGADYYLPKSDQPLLPNDVIQIVRVTEDFITVDEEIPFETLWQATDQLELDERAQLQAGQTGLKRLRVRVRYENGAEVSRTPDEEIVVQEPQAEIMGYGTRVEIRTLNTDAGPVTYYRKVKMRVTSYMAQTSGKPPDHPAYGITASGVVAGYGVVAVDPKVVPFRSNVYVPGYGEAFVGDTGGGVKGRWIDLGYEDDWDTFTHWSGYIDVYYLTPVPETINYLLPTQLP